MTDIRLSRTVDDLYDISISNGDIETDDSLETAVIISLFTNRRAPDSVEIPDGTNSRGGWWGDIKPPVAGDEIGSLLWLLSRDTLSQRTIENARIYAIDALKWMIEDGITKTINVTASKQGKEVLYLEIEIVRPRGPNLNLTFEYAWIAQEFKRLNGDIRTPNN